MANLKDIKRRIGSVKNTQQITKAMKLVAAAKLRKAQESVVSARPYAERLLGTMADLAKRTSGDGQHPLMVRREGNKLLIVVATGDKGLCGPFNTNVFKKVLDVIEENKNAEISLKVVGKKGVDFFKNRPWPINESFLDYGKNLNTDYARKVSDAVLRSFEEESADKVIFIYNKFQNVVVQVPQAVQLLPVSLDEAVSDPDVVEFEFEPSPEDVLDGLLRLFVENQIYQGLLESSASENGARMTAMDAATKNAKEMIDNLTLQYNSARQAAITTELIEVVTGADALGG